MIPAFMIERFGKAGAQLIVYGGIAFALLLCALAVYSVGRGDGRRGEVVKGLEREVDARGKLSDAADGAAGRRVDDAVRSTREQEELNDALKAVEDPDRQRALRGCVILRQQGRDTLRIPACRGPAGPVRAPVP